MSHSDNNKPDANQLGSLMGIEADSVSWQTGDLAAILKHLLNAPLDEELLEFDSSVEQTLRQHKLKTFGDAFSVANPPVEILMLVKRFAKHQGQTGSALPRDVAALIYTAAIAAALVRCNQRISEMDNQTLASRLEWARTQSWSDESLSSLFAKAVEAVH